MRELVTVLALLLAAGCYNPHAAEDSAREKRERDDELLHRVPREARLPMVQAKMRPMMGRPESEVIAELIDCKPGRVQGRTTKYKCHVPYFEGRRHPNANIVLTCTDGVAVDWEADGL